MNQKPGDLFLGVIDFFGVLVPGAILALLHGNFLLAPFGLSMGQLQSVADWIPAFFIAFILGHFLLGFSVPLNQLAARFPSKETKAYEQAVRPFIKLPPVISYSRQNLFYSAFSFIRIKSPEALVGLWEPYAPALLPPQIGMKNTKYLLLTSETIDAVEAQRMGLINLVVPHEELDEVTNRLASRILAGGPTARTMFKRMINERITEFDTSIVVQALSSDEGREGVAAFAEKRKPAWRE